MVDGKNFFNNAWFNAKSDKQNILIRRSRVQKF